MSLTQTYVRTYNARSTITRRALLSTPRVLLSTPRALLSTPRALLNTPRALSDTPCALLNTRRALLNTPRALLNTPPATNTSVPPLVSELRNAFGRSAHTLPLLSDDLIADLLSQSTGYISIIARENEKIKSFLKKIPRFVSAVRKRRNHTGSKRKLKEGGLF